jgi:RHS repeat-associated protein
MGQPVDQDNRSRPRVVLLATDRSQSIIGEIVDGQTHTIAYSAYGEQSAQQKVETRLGFNGQLREADIGWYLLGNGYRAYNPRLMRFHSPDSWSPFRGGGLNSYAYCSNEPINSVDPTGHMRVQILLNNRSFQEFTAYVENPIALTPKRPSVIVEPQNIPPPKITEPSTERNLAQTKKQSPVAAPIAAPEPPPSTTKNSSAVAATSSLAPLQPMSDATYPRIAKPEKMPRLMNMIKPYQRPMPRGRKVMPVLPFSASEAQIKKSLSSILSLKYEDYE